ncbi:putative pyranose oxidase [Sparassis latifolia]
MSSTNKEYLPLKDIILHPIHKESFIPKFDVFIAGSGPIGATYARLLVDAGYNVVMVEIGDQDTRIPGAHKKNEIKYQKDVDSFSTGVLRTYIVQGALSPVSVPPSNSVIPTLDPEAWTPFVKDPTKAFVFNGQNPKQKNYNNLGAEAVTRGVGGMSTHWTCATPEFLKGLERPVIFKDPTADEVEWRRLYDSAKALIGTSEKEYDNSIRHQLVLHTLQEHYKDRGVKALPLACHRIAQGSPYVVWHAANDVYGDMFTKPEKQNSQEKKRGYFKLLTNTRCTRLHYQEEVAPFTISITFREVKDLLESHQSGDFSYGILAKTFVIAAGSALLSFQILANSGFGGREKQRLGEPIPNIGYRITEQPMAFCQIVLKKNHADKHGEFDPVPIPFDDPEPQVTIPTSKERPWHAQIHRDAFSYGEVGIKVDPRLVVDLRFFGMQAGVPGNRIYFDDKVTDAYGMPQPTFEYHPTEEYAKDTHRMMNDMTDVASTLGGYLPGSYPQFMTPGLALHLGGTTRLGQGSEINESVANYNSQVWKFTNLYVAGNGVIPTAFAANPTLTSMCLAIRSAYKISQDLAANSFKAPQPDETLSPTPQSWVDWAFKEADPNFPEHRRELHRSI